MIKQDIQFGSIYKLQNYDRVHYQTELNKITEHFSSQGGNYDHFSLNSGVHRGLVSKVIETSDGEHFLLINDSEVSERERQGNDYDSFCRHIVSSGGYRSNALTLHNRFMTSERRQTAKDFDVLTVLPQLATD